MGKYDHPSEGNDARDSRPAAPAGRALPVPENKIGWKLRSIIAAEARRKIRAFTAERNLRR